MAFTVTFDTETTMESVGGTTMVTGLAVSDGGSTGGVVNPGLQGIRKVYASGFTNIGAQAAAQVVQSYSAGVDSDILTITTAANATYKFWVIGKSSGNF